MSLVSLRDLRTPLSLGSCRVARDAKGFICKVDCKKPVGCLFPYALRRHQCKEKLGSNHWPHCSVGIYIDLQNYGSMDSRAKGTSEIVKPNLLIN